MPSGLFLATPLVLGVTHAFDADHIAAVSALVSGTERSWRAVRLALVWGLGHVVPLLVVAAIGLLLGTAIPSWAAALAERMVGVMLLALGVIALLGLRSRHIHIHAHSHSGTRHMHFHTHGGHRHDHHHTHAAVLTGAVHGLAGSAAPAILIPLSAAHSAAQVLLFVAAFGLAVAATMATYAFCLSRLTVALGARSAAAALALRYGAAFACLAMGAVWIVS